MTCTRVQHFIDQYCESIEYTLDDTKYPDLHKCDGNTGCDHLKMLKPDYTNLEGVVKVLRGNEVYRVAEAYNGCAIVSAHLRSYKYRGRILQRYILKKPKKRDTNTLLECIKEYKNEKSIPVPDERTLVVHLRLGDNLRFFTEQPKLAKEIKKYLAEHPEIDNITVVTALHYGVAHKGSFYEHSKKRRFGYANQWLYSDLSKKINFDKLHVFLKQFEFPVFIRSNEDVDIDLVYLVYAKHLFAKTGGNFTTLINLLNSRM